MTTPSDLLRELAALARSVAPALAPAGHDELLQALTAAARAMFGAAACSLALLEDDEDELVYVAATGEGAETVVGMRIDAATGLAGYVVQSGQPIAVADLRADARFARDVAEETGYVPRAMLAVPVDGPDGRLGVLTLLDRDTGRDGAAFDLQTASLFARQAGLAISSARAAGDIGRMLLDALAGAAETGTPLLDAVQAASDARPRNETLAVSALLGRLYERSPDTARLAARVVGEFLR